jgi:hypothetical protein
MKGNMTREHGLRWTSYGLLLLLVLAGAYAGMLFLELQETKSAVTAARMAADEASAAATRAQVQVKEAAARLSEAEQKQRDMEITKVLLAQLEPEVVPVLEAGARTGKPAARAAALAAIGVIGQAVHGVKHEPALNAYDRALVADKDNCAAALGMQLSGEKTLEIAPECAARLPGAASAAPAGVQAPGPAADAKPGQPAAAVPAAPAPAAAPDGAAKK